jgi:hypothetical protein
MNDQRGDTTGPAAKTIPWLLVFGMLLSTSLAIILTGQTWRSSPVELTWAWPLLGGWSGWGRATTALAVLTGTIAMVLLWLGWRRARAARLLRPWSWLVLYYGTIFFYIWFLLPAAEVDVIHWAIAAVFLLAATTMVLHGAPLPHPWKGNWCVKPYLYLDLLMFALPFVFWLHFREPVDAGRAAFSFVTYPAYALAQLVALLVLPSALLRALGLPRRGIVIVCATMFALVHWPNPAVMAATFCAMIVWSMAHLGGRRLLFSAVVMGVAATSFTRFVPDSWTEHMKVGPGLVRRRAVEKLGGHDQAEAEGFAAYVIEPEEFLEAIYPPILGREATPQELENWESALLRGLRCGTVFFMASVPEYHVLAEKKLVMPPPPAGIHWTKASPAWRQRLEDLCSIEYWNAHGANVEDFYRAVWTETFLEPYPTTSVPYISGRLSPHQCRRLVEVLHENRRTLRNHPFETIADEDLLWIR